MTNRMKTIIETLQKASDAYYNGKEIMSNFEYDKLYDELVELETTAGFALPTSPTQNAGININENAVKITHEFPTLSLAKTKDINVFPKTFAVRDNKAVVMWKEDGGTLVASYDNGQLTSLATRGNGLVGEDITHNAKYIHGLPLSVPFLDHFVVRGEALMSYDEFRRINDNLPENEEPYKNARNLANSTVSLSPEKEMEHRNIWFHAFKLLAPNTVSIPDTFEKQMQFLQQQGFETTEYTVCHANEVIDIIEDFSCRTQHYAFPVDGLVVAANDVVYAESQPGTGHNPHKLVGFALKWADETVETVLRDIEWSPSRTGLLNPVAIFDPVELEGTTVSRASVHNVSTIRNLQLRIGDTIAVYKANKIIPQIAENVTPKGPLTDIEASVTHCPCCNTTTKAITNNQKDIVIETVICPNSECPAKHIGRYTHFVERDSMNIMGLSKATMETFVKKGWITEFADIYHLNRHQDEIIQTEGFGKRSYTKIMLAVNKSRHTSFVPFLTALGIPNISNGKAKIFAKEYQYDIHAFFHDIHAIAFPDINTPVKDLNTINDIGPVLIQNLCLWGQTYLKYMHDNTDANLEICHLLAELTFDIPTQTVPTTTLLSNKTFVITGDVHHFKNRNELKTKIESLGGKVSGSVSSKTSYLINNDITSTSGKNKKAKDLNIPIISEDDFLNMIAQ